MELLTLNSPRATRARLGKRIGKTGYLVMLIATLTLLVAGAGLRISGHQFGLSLFGLGLLLAMPAMWWKFELNVISPSDNSVAGRLEHSVLANLNPKANYSPRTLWDELKKSWQTRFIMNRLLLSDDMVIWCFSDNAADLTPVLQEAMRLADAAGSRSIEAAHLTVALFSTAPEIPQLLSHLKLQPTDVMTVLAWLERDLAAIRRTRKSFGGIGRDWASGFTPRLDQFGHNISKSIEHNNAHFGSLMDSPGVTAMKNAFAQGTSAVALIGPNGIGKTSHAYALAQDLLAETHIRNLEHRQFIALDPSAIISAAQRPGELEGLLTILLNEAAHAGNIILFMDDAQLFFHSGPGSFDATQILLPVLQSRAVQFVLAMTPHDYQLLKGTNPAFAGLLAPVVLQEPTPEEVLEILCDTATGFEVRHKVMVSYEAIKEAYRLSGRYEQDMAYPGKAIRLLEHALTHAADGVVTTASVQQAIEQTIGVKAGTAAPVEAQELLNLEDRIHQRMINQTRAVQVVASALRRARAGVASPNRPVGSFLFLGPTGVGKTELAKSIAATYFGDESTMIRLDMSEYQQQSDVARILSSGAGSKGSLALSIRERPFSVVLLDEIEKAHPNILNLLLQLLDEGQLTDDTGRVVSFRDAVVICTSNAGADQIRSHIEQGEELESFERELTDQLINSGQFRPELLNRFDEIVLFRPLKPEELAQVVRLMLQGINKTLANQNIAVELTDAAVMKIVEVGNDPRLGARPMRRALQRAVEDTVARKILAAEVQPGQQLTLDAGDLTL